MTIDVHRARGFLTTHGRVLDRARLDVHLGLGDASSVLRALDAYRNSDGGYGRGLEPDLRAWGSQPAAAMHALEIIAEASDGGRADTRGLCDWLDRRTLADGGLPFALPIDDATGCAPFWVDADPTVSSLMMTTQVAANASRVAATDASVADHPWLARASAYCLDAIARIDDTAHAYELMFAIRFLDAAAAIGTQVDPLLDHVGRYVPASGRLHVAGGAEDEMLHPLDLSPDPTGPSRRLFSDEVIAADRARLERLQQPDGGWPVDFLSYSPAAALEWRGYATVAAVSTLLRDG